MNLPIYRTQVERGHAAANFIFNNSTFISLCISPKYVYGLYSGKNFKENGLETFLQEQ